MTDKAQKLLEAVANSHLTVNGQHVEAQTCVSYTREDDQQEVYPLWLAGETPDGIRFDLMVEFTKPVTEESLTQLSKALVATCSETGIAIKKGVL